MPLIKVRSKNERFRRAGLAFTRDGVVIDTSKLTEEQEAGIKRGIDEGMLIVSDADREDSKPAATSPAAAEGNTMTGATFTKGSDPVHPADGVQTLDTTAPAASTAEASSSKKSSGKK